MFILTFEKSRSPKFQKAFDIAINLGGRFDGQTVIIELSGWDDISNLYEKLLPLMSIISTWKSVKAKFNGKSVNPYGFLMQTRHLKECSGNHADSDDYYCWGSASYKGWGCRLVNNLLLYPIKNASYKRNDLYWYNFGNFDSRGVWVINKPLIVDTLLKHASNTGLDLCPFFKIDRIFEAVENLPFEITVDNVSWEYYYELGYVGSSIERIPTNIRHIPVLSPEEQRRRDIKQRIKDLEYAIGMGTLTEEEEEKARMQLYYLKSKYDIDGPLIVPLGRIQLEDISEDELGEEKGSEFNKDAIDNFLDNLLEQRNRKKGGKWEETSF